MSEDFQFCEDAAELGFKTHILPAAKTFHHGAMSYEMDLSKVSAAVAALEREQANAAQPAKAQA